MCDDVISSVAVAGVSYLFLHPFRNTSSIINPADFCDEQEKKSLDTIAVCVYLRVQLCSNRKHTTFSYNHFNIHKNLSHSSIISTLLGQIKIWQRAAKKKHKHRTELHTPIQSSTYESSNNGTEKKKRHSQMHRGSVKRLQ